MGTKNTLMDLNNHLFEQLERLNDDDLSPEELQKEVGRAKAMTGIASQIIGSAGLVLKAVKVNAEVETEDRVPRLLVGDKREDIVSIKERSLA